VWHCACSAAGLQLDLGSLAISNVLRWQPAVGDGGELGSGGSSSREEWLLLDDMQVRLNVCVLCVCSGAGHRSV
jgi:hypothetical protein